MIGRRVEKNMTRRPFGRAHPYVNAAIIGHVDHGKTTLTATIAKAQFLTGMRAFIAYDGCANAAASAGRLILTKILTVATGHRDGSIPMGSTAGGRATTVSLSTYFHR